MDVIIETIRQHKGFTLFLAIIFIAIIVVVIETFCQLFRGNMFCLLCEEAEEKYKGTHFTYNCKCGKTSYFVKKEKSC
jgi:hypothetical protein